MNEKVIKKVSVPTSGAGFRNYAKKRLNKIVAFYNTEDFDLSKVALQLALEAEFNFLSKVAQSVKVNPSDEKVSTADRFYINTFRNGFATNLHVYVTEVLTHINSTKGWYFDLSELSNELEKTLPQDNQWYNDNTRLLAALM